MIVGHPGELMNKEENIWYITAFLETQFYTITSEGTLVLDVVSKRMDLLIGS